MTFRTRFSCEKEIASARLYVTALGIYELLLNGEKVGQDYFAPGFTSYRNQLQYVFLRDVVASVVTLESEVKFGVQCDLKPHPHHPRHQLCKIF